MLNLENFLLEQNSRIINFKTEEKINFLEFTDKEIWNFKNYFLNYKNHKFGNLIIDDFELTNLEEEKFFFLFLNKKVCLLDFEIFFDKKIKFQTFFKIILSYLKIKNKEEFYINLFNNFQLNYYEIKNLSLNNLSNLQKANILLIISFLFDKKQVILDINFQDFFCFDQEIILQNIKNNFNDKFSFVIFKKISNLTENKNEFVNSVTLLPNKKIKINKKNETKSFLNNYKIIFSIYKKWILIESIIFSLLLIFSFSFIYLRTKSQVFEIFGYLSYSFILINIIVFYLFISLKVKRYKNFTIFCFFSKKIKLLIFTTFFLFLYLALVLVINTVLLVIFRIIDYAFISNNFYIIFCLIVFVFLLIFLCSFVLIISFNNLLNYNLVWGKKNDKKIYRSRINKKRNS